MKRFKVMTGLMMALIITATLWAFIPSVAEGAVPKLINFQGVLKDGSGNPVANASYSVTFTIYNAPAGGINLWSETQSVTTTSGLFSVLLGAVTPVPDSAFKDTTRYLGIKVGADPEMTPRQQLVSVAYGFRISSVDGAAGGTITSKVSIGPGHINTGTDAFVAGANNRARGAYSVVSGGGGATAADSNSARGDYSTIGGGIRNTASGIGATVGGGGTDGFSFIGNRASGIAATVGGGESNTASGPIATVGGGGFNIATNSFATVGGGSSNTASSLYATVGGGAVNAASGDRATVGGGESDTASGPFAVVPGGFQNLASGSSSFAAGARAKAIHSGTFVWSEGTVFSSTGVNQFLISAPGGVGIGTNSPTSALGGQVVHINNSSGSSTLRLGDGALNGKQWEIQSTVIGPDGMLNFSNLTNFTNPLTILGNDNVGIGTLTPAARLHVNGTAGNGTGVWSVVSDRRLKKEIEPIQNALETVNQLQPVSFRWKDAKKDAEYGRVRGLIAQDVEKILPEWVKTDPDGYKRLEPIGVDALLIEAIKELKAENEELKKRISELEKSKPRVQVETDQEGVSK